MGLFVELTPMKNPLDDTGSFRGISVGRGNPGTLDGVPTTYSQ